MGSIPPSDHDEEKQDDLVIVNNAKTIKKRRIENERGQLFLNNMVKALEAERERLKMGKVEFAKMCGLTAPSYLTFIDGTANPTLYLITRIADATNIPVSVLLFGRLHENEK